MFASLGFLSFLLSSLAFVREDVSRPEVIYGSRLIYFLFVFISLTGNAISKAPMYRNMNLSKASLGQFISIIWSTFVSSNNCLNLEIFVSVNNLFLILSVVLLCFCLSCTI